VGIRNFEDFITDNALKRMFIMGKYQMIVAVRKGKIVGMITLRNESHISLLFVDKSCHRQGIGRALIEDMADYVKNEMGRERITVNASPYATDFYHCVGFKDTGCMTQKDGIIYTPMEYWL
jgi:predicted GNAT family N-acyltransferase